MGGHGRPLCLTSEEWGEDISLFSGLPAFFFCNPLKYPQKCLDVVVCNEFSKQALGITGWVREGDHGCGQCLLQAQKLLGNSVETMGQFLEHLSLLYTNIQEMPNHRVHGQATGVYVTCRHSSPV